MNLELIDYKNGRSYSIKSFNNDKIKAFITEIIDKYREYLNIIIADPFNFEQAERRVNQETSKII